MLSLLSNKAEQVANIVISSEVYDIPEIAQMAGISEKRVVKILKALISNGVMSWDKQWRAFHGAHINFKTMEVVLKASDASEDGVLSTAKKAVNSVLGKYIKKEPWTCAYCRTSNPGEEITCSSCKATRPE